MTKGPENNNRNQKIYAALAGLILAAGILLFYFYYSSRIGPEQPIPFSHRLHAGKKEISCYICHDGAMKSARAGVPPMETCLLCHDHVIIHHPEIENLRSMYASGEPVEWEKVYNVPDFAYFNHSVHIYRKIDCAECHGDVKAMDRIEMAQEFKMGFCIQCHKENNATTDCFTCHR